MFRLFVELLAMEWKQEIVYVFHVNQFSARCSRNMFFEEGKIFREKL